MTTKYVTTLRATARVLTDEPQSPDVALASIDQLRTLLPPEISPEKDIDIVYIVGNLAVAGLMNLNGDAVTVDDALAVYKQFERRQTNLEHSRKQVVGYILKAGLSEFGTNRIITEDEARAAGVPFNIVTIAALWKVVDRDLCAFIVDNAMTGVDEDALSLSFEVGFNGYSVAVLPPGTTDLSKTIQVISEDDDQFDRYNAMLRINGGSGKMGKNSVGRILSPPLIPLGQGVVTVPAAAVKGITPILSNPNGEWSNSVDAGNGHTYSSTHLTLSPDDAAPVLAYGASIPDSDLYPPQGDGIDSHGPEYGREGSPHITCLYGITNSDAQPVADACADRGPISATLGKVAAFQDPSKPYDVLYIEVDAPDLATLHKTLLQSTEHTKLTH